MRRTVSNSSFSNDEAEALAFGARLLSVWADDDLARPCLAALAKLRAVLPDEAVRSSERQLIIAPEAVRRQRPAVSLTTVKRAIESRHVVRFIYTDVRGRRSERRVRPLALSFFGPVWLLLAWCEDRQDFRNFRLDLVANFRVTDETFREEPGRRVADYLKRERLRAAEG